MLEEEVLALADAFLREHVQPRAQDIDLDPEALREALRGLCERNLMALRRPQEFGGPGISESGFRHFQEQVARYSGSLAFLQTQHQSAVSMIAKGQNEALKREVLPLTGDGRRLIGIGFSQLRRPGPPVLRATPDDAGYLLHGQVPWVTGFGFFGEFLVGATLPTGEAVFGLLPLRDDGPALRVTEPMRLCAMESAQTVAVHLDGYRLTPEQTAFIKPAGWIANSDMINIVLQGHFALGCARGSLDVLQAVAEKKGLLFLGEAFQALDQELEECREATTRWKAPDDEDAAITDHMLSIRAWAIDLAVRCAHSAVAASSGAGNSLSHPAQRLYREALVYTVSAQTTPIMEATLRRLVARGGQTGAT